MGEAIRIAPCVDASFELNGHTVALRLSDASGRQAATAELTAALKRLPPAELNAAIDRLTKVLGVELPVTVVPLSLTDEEIDSLA